MTVQTWYLEVMPMQPPTDMTADGPGRAKFSFNVMARKKPSATFLDELALILEDAGVASHAAGSLYVGAKAVIPDGAGPYLHIGATGGPAGRRTQNVRGIDYPDCTAMIVARAEDSADAEALAWAAYNAFAQVRNQFVVLVP
jgi:hypothetical protein